MGVGIERRGCDARDLEFVRRDADQQNLGSVGSSNDVSFDVEARVIDHPISLAYRVHSSRRCQNSSVSCSFCCPKFGKHR